MTETPLPFDTSEHEAKTEKSVESIIRSRVQAYFEAVDPTITDGTEQQVGPYTVIVSKSKMGNLTHFQAYSDGLEQASYTTDGGDPGNAFEVHSLYGTVADNRVMISMFTEAGKSTRTIVSVPNYHLVPSGQRHSKPIQEFSPDYRAAVSKAFDIKF